MSRFSDNKSRKFVVDKLDNCGFTIGPYEFNFDYHQTINSDKVRLEGSITIDSSSTVTPDPGTIIYLYGSCGPYGEITNMKYMQEGSDQSSNPVKHYYVTRFNVMIDMVSDLIVATNVDLASADNVTISLRTTYFI